MSVVMYLLSVIYADASNLQYPLAVEVVIDHTGDTIRVQAAWKDDSHSSVFIGILHAFENTVHQLGSDSVACISQYLSGLGSSPASETAINVSSEASTAKELETVDSAILDGLQSIISDFLQVNPIILTPSTSFVSLGLDSIKSVGLAKLLSRNGFSVTSTELLQHSSLVSLTGCLALKPRTKEDKTKGGDDPTHRLNDDVVAEIRSQQRVELTDDDIVSFYPTTALQTGMLSQVIVYLLSSFGQYLILAS